MIPLLSALQRRISAETSLLARAELEMEYACCLARIGEARAAQDLVTSVRSEFGSSAGVRLSVWIMVCEGLISYFQTPGVVARDRFRRAHAIARAAQATDLEVLSAAWMAHVDHNNCQYASMGELLSHCLARTDQASDSANLRTFIVAANAATYCGQDAAARSWYHRAHTLAVKTGDQVSIEAILYNRSMLRLARVRAAKAFGESQHAVESLSAREVSSMVSYYRAVGYKSLSQLVVAAQARSDLLIGEYARAAELFRDLFLAESTSSDISDRQLISAELALCRAYMGHFDSARDLLGSMDWAEVTAMSPDDRLVCVAAFKTAAALAGFEISSDLQASYDAARLSYSNEQSEVGAVVHALARFAQ